MSTTSTDPGVPPSQHLLMLELRGAWELGAYFAAYPLLQLGPRGDGHPLLVLPGMAASDTSTRPLRALLNHLGYRSHGWELGTNQGPRPGIEARLDRRVEELTQRFGTKVTLIGWSLGGIFAREMARRAPQHVRGVITLGSPFAGLPKASNSWRLYERLSGRRVDDDRIPRERMRASLPVPATAIYSRSDGIVAWQGCLEQPGPLAENIEIEGSHIGLGHNPLALHAIADRLAQPEGQWQRFARSGVRALFYPDPQRDMPARTAHRAA